MDGTLTVPKHDFEEIRLILGVPVGQDILNFVERHPEVERMKLMQTLESWEYQIALQTEISPDAEVLLNYLKENNFKCGVLTRNTHKIALVTLKAAGILDFFDGNVVLGRDSALPKPNPAGILKILSYWGVPGKGTVMIGDDINDVIAGNRAGCTSVYVERNRPLIEPGLADILCSDLKALIV